MLYLILSPLILVRLVLIIIIPVKNFEQNWDISSHVLHPIINKAIIQCKFPDKLKYADIAPLHKCDDTNNKKKL